MGKKGFRRIGLAISALLLALLVGCQAVGGVNLNDMLVNQMDVTSSESTATIAVQLNWDEEKLAQEDEETRKVIDLFRKITLQITDMKSDTQGNLLVDGKLVLSKGEIPFTVNGDKNKLLLRLGGVNRPFVLDLAELGEDGLSLTGEDSSLNQVTQEALKKVGKQAVSYLVGHLPNPPVIQAEPVTLPINGVSTDLMKVHAELNGEQFGGLIPTYLDSLLSDSQGLHDLLTQIVKSLDEMPSEIKSALGLEESDALPTDEEISKGVENILDRLKSLRTEVDKAQKEPEWQDIFNKEIMFKTDLYVDKSLQLRKSSSDLVLGSALFEGEDMPLQGITVHVDEESWNVNGGVVVPEVSTPANALTEEDVSRMEPYQFLRQMDSGSVLYDLLKNDFQIDDQSFSLSSDWGVPFLGDDEGNVYVPVKETLRQFGDPMTFDPKTKKIRFYDDATTQDITLTLGLATATVNGAKVQLQAPVVRINGISYATADDLLGLLHATYSLEDSYDDEQLLYIDRDL